MCVLAVVSVAIVRILHRARAPPAPLEETQRIGARSGGCSEPLSLGLTPPGASRGRVVAVHLHCLITDGAYEEQNDGEQRFLAAPPPTPERMMAVLAQVHEVVRAADDDPPPSA